MKLSHTFLLIGAIVIAVVAYRFAGPLLGAEDPKIAFKAELADAPPCQRDEDCTVIYTECPLGCAHAVPVAAQKSIEQRARELVEAYNRRKGACAYDCPTARPVVCSAENRCVFAGD